MTTINGNSAVQIIQTNEKPQTQVKAEVKTENAVSINSEQLNVGIKKGIVPTLKGVGAGALGAGAVGFTAPVVARLFMGSSGENWSGVFGGAVGFAGIGIVAGAVAGGITANATNNKLTGTLIGAATTGVIGAILMGVSCKTPLAAGLGLLVGGAAGAVGGFGGAYVAQTK